MTRPAVVALIAVAILTAWQLDDVLRRGGLLGLALAIGFCAIGVAVVEWLGRCP